MIAVRSLLPLCLVGSSQVAAAQVYLGSDLTTKSNRPVEVKSTDLTAVRQAAHSFGRCAVTRRTKAAEKAAKLAVDDGRLRAALTEAAPAQCLKPGSGLYFPPAVLRSAILEGLYERKFAGGSKRDFTSVKPIDFSEGYQKPLSDQALTFVTLAAMGECVARKDQDSASALVLSEPATPTEQGALTRLRPSLPSCLPQGLKWRLSIDMLRGGIAEGLYRLSERAPALAETRQ